MGQGYQECTGGNVEFLKEKYICYKNKSVLLNFSQVLSLVHVEYVFMYH